jgi:hypothetical protein
MACIFPTVPLRRTAPYLEGAFELIDQTGKAGCSQDGRPRFWQAYLPLAKSTPLPLLLYHPIDLDGQVPPHTN